MSDSLLWLFTTRLLCLTECSATRVSFLFRLLFPDDENNCIERRCDILPLLFVYNRNLLKRIVPRVVATLDAIDCLETFEIVGEKLLANAGLSNKIANRCWCDVFLKNKVLELTATLRDVKFVFLQQNLFVHITSLYSFKSQTEKA